MILDKLGDCLSFGLTHELMDTQHQSRMEYLKTAYVFMHLNELMGITAIRKLKNIIDSKPESDRQREEMFEKAVTLITVELKKIVTFNSFGELIAALNSYLIPEWVYCSCNDLFRYIPELYQINDMIYFMNKDNDRYSFRSISVSWIKNINEDCTNDLDKEGYQVISNRYSKILGCNKTLGILYLCPAYMHQMYSEYHLHSRQEVMIREKCLGLIGNMVVVEKDGFIMVKTGEKYRKIRKISVLEKYEIENNEIYVTPRYGEPGVFKPFRVGISGEKIDVSYLEASNYLWEQMDDVLSLVMKVFRECNGNEYGESKDWNKKRFTLGALYKHYEEVNKMENNKKTRVYQFIVELLSKYIERDADVLDVFYILLDASRRYEEQCWGGSISEKVYWRLVEMDETGELEKSISDLASFKRKVLEDVYWTDEKLKEKENMLYDCGCIGSFAFRKGKLVSDVVPMERGCLVGSSILISPEGNDGLVTYNIEKGEFQVQYPRLMSIDEIEAIAERFDLEDRTYHIVIEEKSLQTVN